MAYWVETSPQKSLAIAARPRGGDWLESDLMSMRREGISVLVSLLTAPEQMELGLEFESAVCEQAGIEYINFPIPDREVPASQQTWISLLGRLQSELRTGNNVAAHCRAGIGRSSVLIASLLCAQGFYAQEAFALLTKARGLAVPDTPEQIRWVEALADTLRKQ